MRRILTLSAAAIGLLVSGSQAGSDFALGMQFGSAHSDGGTSNFSGLTARFGSERTIEGILAFDHGNPIFNGNFLVHGKSLLRQDPIQSVKLYGGFGLGAWTGGDGGMWAQIPLGVDFLFAVPVEASLYVAPGLDMFPDTKFTTHWGLGLRYWFN